MTRSILLPGLLFSVFGFPLAPAQSPPDAVESKSAKTVLSEGEVTARDVYVRSGPSLNHYEICKLQSGEKVSIVGYDGDWYEILPPREAFSLISGDYVDTTDNQNGVVNGDNVRVRAGSTLNANKYTVQTLLSRGAKVTILGSNPDGFLRIKPPPGATLWINKQFVKSPVAIAGHVAPRSTASTSGAAPVTAAGSRPSEGSPAEQPLVETDSATTSKTIEVAVNNQSPTTGNVASAAESDRPSHEYRRELESLDEAARKELAKELADREWAPLLARYEEIARLADDEVSRVYARHRVEQLTDLMAVTTTIRELKSLNESSDEVRRAYLESRNRLPRVTPIDAPVGMDAQGELRVSALYPPGSLPRRYRLIDPTATPTRTVAYVEIPPNSRIDADSFIGKFVGVRASEKSLQTSGLNPIPILVASEIVPMEPPGKSTDSPAPPRSVESMDARG